MTTAVKGKTIEEARQIINSFKHMMSIHESGLDEEHSQSIDDQPVEAELGDLAALRGVVKFPVRIKCATLGWNTFNQALKDAGNDDQVSPV